MPAQYIVARYTDRATNDPSQILIAADLCDPPTLKVDKDRQFAAKGRRSAVTVYGRWYEGRIRVPHMTGTARVQWRKFLESIAEDERFELDFTQLDGFDADVLVLTVYCPDDEVGTPRLGVCDDYATEFSWREVDS